jgi:hypothetical protein
MNRQQVRNRAYGQPRSHPLVARAKQATQENIRPPRLAGAMVGAVLFLGSAWPAGDLAGRNHASPSRYRPDVRAGIARQLGGGGPQKGIAAQGLRYDIHKTVINTPAPDSTNPTPTTDTLTALAHAQVANGKVRIDVVSGYFVGIWLSPGDYLLVTDSGRSAVLVNPQNKMYANVDLAQLRQQGTDFANAFGPMMGVQSSNVKVEGTALGTEKLPQGAASKFRITEDYTVTMAVMGMDAATTTHQTTDLWYLPASSSIASPFGVPITKDAPTTGFFGPDYAKQMTAAKAILPTGMPVKITAATTTTDKKGNHAQNITTWEFTNIAQGTVADNAFDVPAGYTQFTGPLAMMPTPTAGASTAAKNGKSAGSTVGNAAGSAASGVGNAAASGATNAVNQAASDAAASTVKKILHLP